MSARRWCRAWSIAAPRATAIVPVAADELRARRRRLPVMAGDKQVGTTGLALPAGRGLAHAAARPRRRRAGAPARRSPPAASPSSRVKPDWATFDWPGEAKALNEQRALLARRRPACAALGRSDDPLYVAYHDDEWGVPEYDDRALYEKLVLDGFQAGLSWITILRKRDNFRRAFDGFDPEKIARYDARRRSSADGRTPASCATALKIEGAVLSARAYLEVDGKGAGLLELAVGLSRRQAEGQQVPRHQTGAGGNRAVAEDVEGAGARGFKFVGPTIVYAFMQAVGMVNDHLVTCHRHAACAKLARETMSKKATRARSSSRAAPRAWQRMLSGRRLDLLDPSPLDVEIEDIAHGLARVARWNGQTKGAHIFRWRSTRCWSRRSRARKPRLDAAARLAVLLHDAPEYVIGDMISPFKAVIGDTYKAVEARLLAAIICASASASCWSRCSVINSSTEALCTSVGDAGLQAFVETEPGTLG